MSKRKKSAAAPKKSGRSSIEKADGDNPILEAALAYQAIGLSVVPTKRGDKRPDLRSWKKYQLEPADRATVRRWFRGRPDRSIGIILGKVSGGLTVADFDDMKAYEAWKDAYPKLAAKLPTVKSGKGCHVYFRSSNAKRGKLQDLSGQCEGDAGDLLAAGWLVVVPPSRHASGKLYTWVTPLPDNINDIPKLGPVKSGFISRQPRKKKAAANPRFGKEDDIHQYAFRRTQAFIERGVPKGKRNNELYYAAWNMAGLGLPIERATHLLQEGCEKCFPPYRGKQVQRTIKSAYKNSRPLLFTNPLYAPPIPLALLANSELPDSAKLIWVVIEHHHRMSEGEYAFPGIATIARMIGRNEETVRTGIQALEKAGILFVARKPGEHNNYITDLPPLEPDSAKIPDPTPQDL